MSLKMDRSQVYMMPVFYGPTWTNQNPNINPKGWSNYYQPGNIHAAQVVYETDKAALEDIIPDCYTLNDPYISVTACEFANLGWWSGRDYRLINISVPVHFKGERDDLDGDLITAMFENQTDPIVGGREVLAYGKIYSEISRLRHDNDKYILTASYDGFRFMNLELDMSKPAADPDVLKEMTAKSAGTMHYRYIPDIMEKGEDPATNFTKAAIEEPVILPTWQKPDDYPYEMRAPEMTFCDGKVEFFKPTWEEFSTWGNIPAKLNEMGCKRVIGARLMDYDNATAYAGAYKLR